MLLAVNSSDNVFEGLLAVSKAISLTAAGFIEEDMKKNIARDQ